MKDKKAFSWIKLKAGGFFTTDSGQWSRDKAGEVLHSLFYGRKQNAEKSLLEKKWNVFYLVEGS